MTLWVSILVSKFHSHLEWDCNYAVTLFPDCLSPVWECLSNYERRDSIMPSASPQLPCPVIMSHMSHPSHPQSCHKLMFGISLSAASLILYRLLYHHTGASSSVPSWDIICDICHIMWHPPYTHHYPHHQDPLCGYRGWWLVEGCQGYLDCNMAGKDGDEEMPTIYWLGPFKLNVPISQTAPLISAVVLSPNKAFGQVLAKSHFTAVNE